MLLYSIYFKWFRKIKCHLVKFELTFYIFMLIKLGSCHWGYGIFQSPILFSVLLDSGNGAIQFAK